MGKRDGDDRSDDESRDKRKHASRRRNALRSSLAVAVVFVVGSAVVDGEVTPGTVLAAVCGPIAVLGLTYHPGPLPSRPAKVAAVLLSIVFVALAIYLQY